MTCSPRGGKLGGRRWSPRLVDPDVDQFGRYRQLNAAGAPEQALAPGGRIDYQGVVAGTAVAHLADHVVPVKPDPGLEAYVLSLAGHPDEAPVRLVVPLLGSPGPGGGRTSRQSGRRPSRKRLGCPLVVIALVALIGSGRARRDDPRAPAYLPRAKLDDSTPPDARLELARGALGAHGRRSGIGAGDP